MRAGAQCWPLNSEEEVNMSGRAGSARERKSRGEGCVTLHVWVLHTLLQDEYALVSLYKLHVVGSWGHHCRLGVELATLYSVQI